MPALTVREGAVVTSMGRAVALLGGTFVYGVAKGLRPSEHVTQLWMSPNSGMREKL